MKNKRLLACLLAAVMVLSLAACTNNGSSNEGQEGNGGEVASDFPTKQINLIIQAAPGGARYRD